MDRRAARTRRALHTALMSLIRRKSYEAITVQEVLDEADVGRSTFYAHYTGKEDLLRGGFAILRAELEEARRAHRTQEGLLGFSLAIFEHAGRHAAIYRSLVGSRGHAVVISEIRRVLMETAKAELRGERKQSHVPEELTLQFIAGTFLTVLTWWLERKPKLTPAQVNAMFRELVLGESGSPSTVQIRS